MDGCLQVTLKSLYYFFGLTLSVDKGQSVLGERLTREWVSSPNERGRGRVGHKCYPAKMRANLTTQFFM